MTNDELIKKLRLTCKAIPCECDNSKDQDCIIHTIINAINNWDVLKADITKAVNTGCQNGYHLEERTEPKGRFEAYRYVIDKMEALEKYEE